MSTKIELEERRPREELEQETAVMEEQKEKLSHAY